MAKGKKNRDSARSPSDLLRVIADNPREMIYRFELEPEPGFQFVREGCHAIFWYTPQEFYDRPLLISEIRHPEDQLTPEDRLAEIALASGGPSNHVSRYIHRDGSIVWAEQRPFAVHDEAGKVIATQGIIFDVTAQKKAEQRLGESEERFRLLAERSNDVVHRFAFKPRCHYAYVSPSALEIFGYPPQAFYEDEAFLQKIVHPEDRAKLTEWRGSKVALDRRLALRLCKKRWAGHLD